MPPSEVDGVGLDRAAMLGNDGGKHELEQPPQELPASRDAEAPEMPAEHGKSELARNASSKTPPGIESRHEMPAQETLAVSRLRPDDEAAVTLSILW